MPPVVLERPKMSRPMWDSLKGHIMRERQRKKQDQEADAEVERQRKERERQQKQHVFTLNETREQITQSEARLTDLKEEKHQLFLQLKKVLNEDEIRKRQLMSQENEMIRMHQYNVSQYTNPPRIQMVSSEQSSQHHPGFIQPIQLTRTPVSIAQAQVFKVEGGGRHPPPVQTSHHSTSPHNSMPITVKRLRTPSPPPPQNYRFGPFKPPPQAIPQYSHQKPSIGGGGGGLQYFQSSGPPVPSPQQQQQQQHSHSQQQQQQHSQHSHQQHSQQQHSQQQPHGVSFSSVPHSSQGPYAYSNAPPSRSPHQTSAREESQKHVAGPMFIHGSHMPRSYVIQQQAAEQHSRSSPHSKFPDDSPKYYPPPTHGLGLRGQSHLSIHPGLTIQNQSVPGGITSGNPFRTQPNSAAYQGRPPSPQVQAYSIPGGPPRLTYGHPHGQMPQHPGIQRYSLPPGVQRD